MNNMHTYIYVYYTDTLAVLLVCTYMRGSLGLSPINMNNIHPAYCRHFIIQHNATDVVFIVFSVWMHRQWPTGCQCTSALATMISACFTLPTYVCRTCVEGGVSEWANQIRSWWWRWKMAAWPLVPGCSHASQDHLRLPPASRLRTVST